MVFRRCTKELKGNKMFSDPLLLFFTKFLKWYSLQLIPSFESSPVLNKILERYYKILWIFSDYSLGIRPKYPSTAALPVPRGPGGALRPTRPSFLDLFCLPSSHPTYLGLLSASRPPSEGQSPSTDSCPTCVPLASGTSLGISKELLPILITLPVVLSLAHTLVAPGSQHSPKARLLGSESLTWCQPRNRSICRREASLGLLVLIWAQGKVQAGQHPQMTLSALFPCWKQTSYHWPELLRVSACLSWGQCLDRSLAPHYGERIRFATKDISGNSRQVGRYSGGWQAFSSALGN